VAGGAPAGRAPPRIHRAILAGDRVTGITIMRVVQALDAGPMLLAAETPIDPADTSASLEQRLAALGADLVVRVIDDLEAGPLPAQPQDETRVKYAARLSRTDGRVDFAQSAMEVHNAIRGLQPWPLVSVDLEGKRLLLLESEPRPDEHTEATPGTIVRVEPDALAVATGHGVVLIRRVQLEGRPALPVRDFLHGHRVQAGTVLLPWPATVPGAPAGPVTR
jgi:methionyl-tRNA formyltransferase